MKKIFLSIIAAVLNVIAFAQTESMLDSSQFVAFYTQTINTKDCEGRNVTDSIRLALLVGTRATSCMAAVTYEEQYGASPEMLNVFIMHHQSVFTDLDKKDVTALEPLFPYRYVTHEPMADIKWSLSADTMTIAGLLCRRASGELYGKRWTAWYAESMPSSAGPWKLRGLPGLIVKAEDADGIHRFLLYETQNVSKEISPIGTDPNYQRLSREKLMRFKKKTLGNSRYPGEPTYYVPEDADAFAEIDVNGVKMYIGMGSHMLVPYKSHVYKPLELK